jgi:hypothetical protein
LAGAVGDGWAGVSADCGAMSQEKGQGIQHLEGTVEASLTPVATGE